MLGMPMGMLKALQTMESYGGWTGGLKTMPSAKISSRDCIGTTYVHMYCTIVDSNVHVYIPDTRIASYVLRTHSGYNRASPASYENASTGCINSWQIQFADVSGILAKYRFV